MSETNLEKEALEQELAAWRERYANLVADQVVAVRELDRLRRKVEVARRLAWDVVAELAVRESTGK